MKHKVRIEFDKVLINKSQSLSPSRLTYHNLKVNPNMNVLSPEEQLEIWTPKLIFDNTVSSEETLTDSKSYTKVIPNKNFTYTQTGLQSIVGCLE